MSPKWGARLGVITVGIMAALVGTVLIFLAAADQGSLDGVIQSFAASKAHRPIHFDRLHAHLLALKPGFEVEGLVIGSPPAVTSKDLLHASKVTAHLKLAPLLLGRLEATDVAVDGADLHLVRLGPSKTNYSFGGSSAGGTLRTVNSLSAPGGHLTYEDPLRGLTLIATFDHAGRPGPSALTLTGRGVVKGQPFEVVGEAGAFNNREPNAPYPIHAEMRDGGVSLSLKGVTQKPFDFRTVDLTVAARGPNLAALGYLFNFTAPNSPPFDLTANLRRGNRISSLLSLKAHLGHSDVAGEIVSDHSRSQRMLTAHLISNTLVLADVRVMLAKPPDHAVARSVPGARAVLTNPKFFSEAQLPLDRLRDTDAAVDLKASHFIGLGAGAHNVTLQLRLRGGRLALSPVRAELGSGVLKGSTVLDVSGDTPIFTARADFVGGRLSQIRPDPTPKVDADIDLHLAVTGKGGSAHLIASTAAGKAAFDLSHGVIPKVKAAALGGDLIQAVALSLAGDGAETSLDCGAGTFDIARGVLRVRELSVFTGEGEVGGQGLIDLGKEQVSLTFEGRPSPSKGAKVIAPVMLAGAIGSPKVSVKAAQGLHKAGLNAVGALLSLPAAIVAPKRQAPPPPSRCQALLASARRFVGP